MLKVDTKEKFSIVRLSDGVFTVNVSDDLTTFVTKQFTQPEKSVIIDFAGIASADRQALADLATLHQQAKANKSSLVICNLSGGVQNTLDELDLTGMLNITPTESEAWDIVQMEEIERELLGDED